MRFIGLYLGTKYEVYRSNSLWAMNTGQPDFHFDGFSQFSGLIWAKNSNFKYILKIPLSCFTIIPDLKWIGQTILKLFGVEIFHSFFTKKFSQFFIWLKKKTKKLKWQLCITWLVRVKVSLASFQIYFPKSWLGKKFSSIFKVYRLYLSVRK